MELTKLCVSMWQKTMISLGTTRHSSRACVPLIDELMVLLGSPMGWIDFNRSLAILCLQIHQFFQCEISFLLFCLGNVSFCEALEKNEYIN